MIPRFIDWIWHVRGSVPIPPQQSSEDTFARLDPLFHETGTSYQRTSHTLIFRKKDQAAQDKMSVFDSGVLCIEPGAAGAVLRYHLVSRALLFCFLAPLLFLAFAQLTIVMGELQGPSTEASGGADKPDEKDAEVPMNPLDKALGAPAPEKSEKKGEGAEDGEDDKPSPTPAYVFAAIFACLYVGGRILEDRLVKALFRKRLLGS